MLQFTKTTKSHHISSHSKKNQQGITSWIMVLFAVALILVSIIVSTLTYRFSYRKGYHEAIEEAKISSDGVELNAEGLKSIQLENEIIKNEAEAAKQERDITLKNLADLRTKLEEQTVTNLQLQQTLDIYGKTIAKQGGIPLEIIGAKIEPLPENAFEYRFDVLKLAKDGAPRTLRPKMQLLNDTSFVEIPLQPSSYNIAGVARIRGRFIMPKGFRPLQVKLILSAGGEELEQLYNWRFGKRKNNIPLSLAEMPDTDQRPITND